MSPGLQAQTIVLDLLIIGGAALSMGAVGFKLPFRRPITGLHLITTAILVIGILCTLDLASIFVLSTFHGSLTIKGGIEFLHGQIPWISTLAALPLMCVGILKVAREDHRTLHRIRALENRATALSRVAFEGIWVTKNGKCIEISDRLADRLGYESGELVGRHVSEFIESPFLLTFMTELEKESSGIVEIILKKKDGSPVLVEICSTNMVENGETLGMSGAREISRKLEQQRELVAFVERDRREFVENLARGTRGLLKSLSAFVDAFRLSDEGASKTAEAVKILNASILQSTATIEHFVETQLPSFDNREFVYALETLVEHIHKNFDAHVFLDSLAFEVIDNKALFEDLYQIIRQNLYRAITLSGARSIALRCAEADGMVAIEILDDRRADPEQKLVLELMRCRAVGIGATIDVSASRQGGTRFVCRYATHKNA